MNNYRILFIISILTFSLFSCEEEVINQMSEDYPQDYDINYEIRQVLQYDPVNIKGIDVSEKLDFFNTIRFSLHYNDGELTHISYTNGDVPFSPFNFEIDPGVKTEVELDYDVMPNELRIKGTDNVVAYFQNGEFIMPFALDCGSINYKYTFKDIQQD